MEAVSAFHRKKIVSTDRSWQNHANRLGVNPELFFPERNEDQTRAKGVCAGCRVRGECLEYALVNFEQHGIWGGMSERQRRDLRKQRREQSPNHPSTQPQPVQLRLIEGGNAGQSD